MIIFRYFSLLKTNLRHLNSFVFLKFFMNSDNNNGSDFLVNYLQHFTQVLIEYSPRILSSVLIFIIGWFGIRLVKKIMLRVLSKQKLDPTLSRFLNDIIIWMLKLLLFVTIISRLGVENSSFVAIIGAASLAVGLALQGSLSNFAGGVLIMMFKPFRIGDYISAQGIEGTVEEIQIFVTRIIAPNNQIIFVPNGVLSNGTIINYSHRGLRRVEFNIKVKNSSDININKVKTIILQVIDSNMLALKDPAPEIQILDLTDTVVHLGFYAWAKNEDFQTMRSDVLENIKEAFEMSCPEIG